MIKIYSNIVPPSGFIAMTIFPFLFIRKKMSWRFDDVDERHETIHGRQQIELLLLLFFVWYGIEYFVRWICYGFDGHLAYRNISFEQEAYLNETNLSYPYERKLYAWLRFLFKKTYVRDAISRKIVKKQ